MKKKPIIGVVVVTLLLGVSVWLVLRSSRGGEVAEMAANVTIRDRETGETWQMPRGVLEKQLYGRAFPIDPTEGLPNPISGKPTGFTSDWEQMVARINAERKALRDSQPGGPPAAGN